MSSITVDCKKLKGEVRVPVSKSILHRYLLCAYVQGDYDTIRNIESRVGRLSDDVLATKSCLEKLMGAMPGSDEAVELCCHESGTTLRFMIPLVAAMGVRANVTAEGSLVGRPMKPFIDELNRHGADIEMEIVTDTEVYKVSGELEAGDYKLPGNISSQFVSGLMLASDLVDGDLWICTEDELQSSSYVEMTGEVIKAYSKGGQDKLIEGDWSNGAMWVVANDLLGGKLKVNGLSAESIQGDRQIISILNDFAIDELMSDTIAIDVSDCPDLVPAIALRAVTSPMVTTITNAGRLRYKESNRLIAIQKILATLGADICIGDDGSSLIIRGTSGNKLPGNDTLIETFGDHRMVMLAVMASIITDKPVKVGGIESVSKSYPEFFEDVGTLGGIVE